MESESKRSQFARFSWVVLAYNLVVIIWGVFLRASHSGDGCGQHWITCNGEAIPSAGELKAIIEFSHRITTALAGLMVVAFVIWAFRAFGKGHPVRMAALVSLVFIVAEGLLGAGLVLTGNTAGNWTPTRPYWTIGHLINTFLLLAALTSAAWLASSGKKLAWPRFGMVWLLLSVGIALILTVGVSGSLAALSNMFHPAGSITEGLASDFAETSPMLVRLRISHPIISILTAVFLFFLSGWARNGGNASVVRWSKLLSILVFVQLASGAATLFLHAPIVMQLVHLFLADSVWIAFLLMAFELLSNPPESLT